MQQGKKQINVLLVDDEVDFLESSAKALEKRGFVVHKAVDGRTALAMVRAVNFDAVILDLRMPDIDGEEVFCRIHRENTDLPVIMLTGHGSVPHAFKTAKKGIADYIAKPCDIDLLVERIRSAIRLTGKQSRERLSRVEREETHELISVLIIDDRIDLLESLKSVLERRSMHVFTVCYPSLAFKLLEDTPIHVVVLDIKLPEMDGLDVLKRIKKQYPHIEVILFTAYPSVDTALEGINQGAYTYITKPADPEELTTKIRSAYRTQLEKIENERQRIVEDITRRYPE